MKRDPVTSSNIRSVGYDATQNVLEVEFSSGSVYAYEGVSPETAKELMEAESVGRYFAQSIRPSFKSKRIDVES